MAFGIGINTQQTNVGEIRGVKKEIACQCWFSSKGKTIPLMIKYQDEEGLIHMIRQIEILYSEENNYAGIPTIKYNCNIEYNDMRTNVNLYFNKKDCKWTMVLQ